MSHQSLNYYLREIKTMFTQKILSINIYINISEIYIYIHHLQKLKAAQVSFNGGVDKETDRSIQKNPAQE